jgi:hypothetical protein
MVNPFSRSLGRNERPIDFPQGRSNDPGSVPVAADNPQSIKVGAWHC